MFFITFISTFSYLFFKIYKNNWISPDSHLYQNFGLSVMKAVSLLELHSLQFKNISSLSGGEKQRLSIARALLRHPHLLIFDEATSSLDSLTEESITDTIRKLSAERAQITIMIEHRLSTIIHATKIYLLEKGQIIEKGTHESLLLEKGLYYAMWRQQIGERRAAI